jgi:hypothetical protein
LFCAGALAFALYLVAFELWAPRTDEFEITAFTTPFQAAAFLVCVAIANGCFFLGPALERFVPTAMIPKYRKWAFRAGLGVSVALPLLVPVLFYLGYGRGG